MTGSKLAWPGSRLARTCILIACQFLLALWSTAAVVEPTIDSILVNHSNILIKVTAPVGIRKVMLESRSRAEGSVWSPRAIHRFAAALTSATEISFEVANAENFEFIRVRADDTEAFSAQFFTGQTAFTESVANVGETTGTTTGGTTTSGGTTTGTTSGSVPDPPGPAVSDMWKVEGDILYYFNQNRGLQIIDLANPSALSLRASYPLAGRGNQMHVLSNGTVLLLARLPCSNAWLDQSKLIALNTAVLPITRLSEQPLEGSITHSSVLGNYLYTVSVIYRPATTTNSTGHTNSTGQVWEMATEINSFDLSNPAAPLRRATLTETGHAGVVSLTDRFLFVAIYGRPGASAHDLHIYDLAGADGAIRRSGNIRLSGYIRDPDKIRFQDGVLTFVHHRLVWENPWQNPESEAKLVNYSLANPDLPVVVGELELPPVRELTVSRFEGNRFYVEIYGENNSAPVLIFDLSNPAQPRLAGQVAMPGWITILQPLGNRLIAMGIDNTAGQQVALALFDVTDPATASLRTRVTMGGTNYSYSAALYDPSAWNILPDQNLILAPWSGRPGPNGTEGLLEVIDFQDFNLNSRSTIVAGYDPRRSVLHRGHIITISSGELFSFDLINRSEPVLKSKLSLAWPVDKVLVVGDHLLEFETGVRTSSPHFDNRRVCLRVVRADAPENALTVHLFDPLLPIAGAEIKEGKLYLAQSREGVWTNADTTSFVLSIWDLSALPVLRKISDVKLNTVEGFEPTMTALWPKPNLLVWSGGGMNRFIPPVVFTDGHTTPASGAFTGGSTTTSTSSTTSADGPAFPVTRNTQLLGFDVSNPDAIEFESHADLGTTNSVVFTVPVVSGRLVYTSHQAMEFIPAPSTNPPSPTTGHWGGTDPQPQGGIIITRWFLNVVDFTDSANPVVRRRVSIPGPLRGVTHNGEIIYTVGSRINEDGSSNGKSWLDASAYDGVAAYLVDSLEIPGRPVVQLDGADIFVGGKVTNQLQRWRLSDSAILELLSSASIPEDVRNLRFLGNLLVIQGASNFYLFDATNRAGLRLKAADSTPCGWGFWGALDDADGDLARGLWFPLSWNGIQFIPMP